MTSSTASWVSKLPVPAIKPTPGFLQGTSGPLFTLYYPSYPAAAGRGSILYLHPFAEELNKSRRMAALQARCLAAAGFAVLLPDLYGCGDSSGDFADARWTVWQADLRLCLDWLLAHSNPPLYLWGLRLGGLLAAEIAREVQVDGLILWQSVIDGGSLLTQFLRLRLAAGLFSGNQETLAQLRTELAAGHVLEVAGYALHPELAAALEQARLPLPRAGIQINWFEVVATPGRALAPPSQQLLQCWQTQGVAVTVQTVVGEPFWSTQEICCVPALLEATTHSLQ